MRMSRTTAIWLLLSACGDKDPELCDTGQPAAEWLDVDRDGFVAADDCDDQSFETNPAARERCDGGLDNNCDGTADGADAEGAVAWFADGDGDGFGEETVTTSACEAPEGFTGLTGDCDDTDGNIFPGNVETWYDGLDGDCARDDGYGQDQDGWVQAGDEGLETEGVPGTGALPGGDCDDEDFAISPEADEVWYDGVDADCAGDDDYDQDHDGHQDEDYGGDDCDDLDDTVNPGETDIPDDGVDQDCVGGDATSTVCDGDGDGYDDAITCGGLDCDDTDPTAHPGGTDLDCDGIDQDCDGADTCISCDLDGDGYDDATTCGGLDCDDGDAAINPGAPEICDGADNDCDGAVDAADGDVVGTGTWYEDTDGDGYGDAALRYDTCSQPPGTSADPTDCDDAAPSVNPAATEVCDSAGVDEDCDGLVDDADSSVTGTSTWYLDSDGDGYGLSTSAVARCDSPSGYAALSTDCEDGDSAVHPGATEVCDSQDNDCDALVDDADSSVTGTTTWYLDSDSDGYGLGTTTTSKCSLPSGYAALSTDCDDTLSSVNPGETEVCDGANLDEDCDGLADDLDSSPSGTSTWYLDSDADGYGVSSTTTNKCDFPSGYSSLSTDCDDSRSGVNPGASEVCDSANRDEDCDGIADDLDSSVTGTSTWYRDADSDGYGTSLFTKAACDLPTGYTTTLTDCDDNTAVVYPGATEVCVDRQINNCSATLAATKAICVLGGVVDLSVPDAKMSGASGDSAGKSVASVGDWDGDGLDDVLVGAENNDAGGSNAGAAYLLLGSMSGSLLLSAASATFTGAAVDDAAGAWVAGPGDVDRDGFSDALIGAYANNDGGALAGEAYLIFGPTTGSSSLAAADLVLVGEQAGDFAGFPVAGAGDFDGDGFPDLLVGAYGSDTAGAQSGSAYLVYGPSSGTLDLSLAQGKLNGEAAGDEAGRGLAGGDVDGDGMSDLVTSGYLNDGAGVDAGAVYVLLAGSGTPGTMGLASADARFRGVSAGDQAGYSVASKGDSDGDGYVDLLVGAPGVDSGGSNAGAAYLVLGGSMSGTASLSTANAKMVGSGAGSALGSSVAFGGRLDLDSYDDILLGAPSDGSAAPSAGAVYLLSGPVSGTFSVGGADAILLGDTGEQAGWAVSGAGDTDGDGYGDVLLGAPGASSGAGVAFLIWGSRI